MKIIEAMKKIKDLQRKADDIKEKIGQHCADLECENPVYPDQRRQIAEWLQSHTDIIKEISHLRFSLQKTNIVTQVSILLGDKSVTKSICEWIHRRKDLAKNEEAVWRKLADRDRNGMMLKTEYKQQLTPQSPEFKVSIRRYFDPTERDRKVELYRSEPSAIDAALETVNAVTDLV